uniref:Putative structural protein n=1 Tax=viral metagenome TaxID=1070528 RepID=A0A6H1ZS52_9ZZZZ
MAIHKTEAVLSGNCPDRADGSINASWGHWAYDDEGAVVIDDVIQMVNIPAGARIIDILVEWPATFAGSSTFDVGDGDDDDRFMAAIANATNAGRLSLFGGFSNTAEIDEAINASGLGYTYSAADTIDITVEGANTATGDIFIMCVLYIVEGGFTDE